MLTSSFGNLSDAVYEVTNVFKTLDSIKQSFLSSNSASVFTYALWLDYILLLIGRVLLLLMLLQFLI